MAKVHDFKEDLAWSQNEENEKFWVKIYKKHFPDLISMTTCNGKCQAQRLGMDRIIMLSSGKTLKIEEKRRREDRDDILIEYSSGGYPGWANKELLVDYLAYGMQTKAYIFPWDAFRRAWKANEKQWKKKYEKKTARNSGYNTLFVIVPIDVVIKSVSKFTVMVGDEPCLKT